MKYPKSTALGDAGEIYFAYKIASVLRWPCRLFDIDIGIDAQVEIMEGGQSTGKFVAFQIKTSTSDHKFRRYVTDDQINYWTGLSVPVFAVLVDMPSGDMYFHLVAKDNEYPLTGKGNRRISFDPASEQFTEASGAAIREASDKIALGEVMRYLRRVEQGAEQIRGAIVDFEENPDPPRAIELMRRRVWLRGELSKAKTLARSHRVGLVQCTQAETDLNDALKTLREYASENWLRRDWDDPAEGDGDIRRFLDE